jgi:hypothetical protein
MFCNGTAVKMPSVQIQWFRKIPSFANKIMNKTKFASYVTIIALFALVLGSAGLSTTTSAATCKLTKIWIAQASLSPTTEKVSITATPLCWSGAVQVNRAAVDFHLITVQITNGHGTGTVLRTGVIQPIHPYATNPGLRGNNIMVPALT